MTAYTMTGKGVKGGVFCYQDFYDPFRRTHCFHVVNGIPAYNFLLRVETVRNEPIMDYIIDVMWMELT